MNISSLMPLGGRRGGGISKPLEHRELWTSFRFKSISQMTVRNGLALLSVMSFKHQRSLESFDHTSNGSEQEAYRIS